MNNATDIAARIQSGLTRRYRAERRFQGLGISALLFAGAMLGVLLITILRPGILGFTRHELLLTLPPTQETTDDYSLTRQALRAMVSVNADDKSTRRALYRLIGDFAAVEVTHSRTTHPEITTVWVPLSDPADQYFKGHITKDIPESERPLTDQQIAWLEQWRAMGVIRYTLNHDFFTRGDSRAPEAAGFLGSAIGSLLTLLVCLTVALPVAIMAAVTLEEFARKTRIAETLEIVINNLAAVPSIIYGLLGLSVYLQWLHLPRSSPLVGGLTLAMLIMPVMIIAARAAIRAVPPSMRQAAAALGATRLQMVRHHVLPYALPGIMTGTILSICRALGETAPLLMIGMVAFVADVPRGPTDPATAMPVQIYLWASSPELGFVEKTSSGILVLLAILLILNAAAIRLRSKSQLTWN